MQSVKYLQLSHTGMSRIGQVTMIRVNRKSTESIFVWGRFTNCMKDFHISYVVDEQGLFQAYHQPLKKKEYVIKLLCKSLTLNPCSKQNFNKIVV